MKQVVWTFFPRFYFLPGSSASVLRWSASDFVRIAAEVCSKVLDFGVGKHHLKVFEDKRMRKNISVSCFRARRFTIKNVVCHININNMFETKIDIYNNNHTGRKVFYLLNTWQLYVFSRMFSSIIIINKININSRVIKVVWMIILIPSKLTILQWIT